MSKFQSISLCSFSDKKVQSFDYNLHICYVRSHIKNDPPNIFISFENFFVKNCVDHCLQQSLK